MKDIKRISSLQNQSIKTLLRLQEKSRVRRKTGLFVVEGLQEIQLALTSGYTFSSLYFCPDLVQPEILAPLKHKIKTCIEVTLAVYQKIAYRQSTEGVIAIGIQKKHDLAEIKLPENPFILVAEAPEKPGNIGALLRTADAADLDAVFIANPKTDVYNPNIIRSSVGCVFTRQIATGNTTSLIQFLEEHHISIYCATLQSSALYTAQDFTQPTAIVVGTEHEGLSRAWRAHSTQNIIIPMNGKVDSMNVSVSAGILVFEAKRQRGF